MIAKARSTITSLFTHPQFPDEDDTYRARLLYHVAEILMAMAVISAIPFILSDLTTLNILSVTISNSIVILAGFTTMAWTRQGRFRQAGIFIILILILITTLSGLVFGITYFPTPAYILVITLAALFLGPRGVIQFGLVSIVGLITVVIVNLSLADITSGVLARTIPDTITNIGGFALISVLLYVGMSHLEQTLTRSRLAEEKIRSLNANLEALVTDRTGELRRTTRLLQALMDNAPMPIFVKEAGSWQYQLINKQFQEFRGNIPGGILHQTDHELYPSAVADEIHITDEVVAEHKRPTTVEINLPNAEGISRTLLSTIFPITDEKELVHAIGGISLDITERKQDELELHLKNEQLTTLHGITLDLLNRENTDDILKSLLDHILHLLDTDHANIDLLENENVIITHIATEGQPLKKGDRTRRGEGGFLTWQAIDLKQPAIVDDYSTWDHRRISFANFAYHAVAQVPMLRENRAIGVLSITRTKPNRPFTKEEIRIAFQLAQIAAMALDNASLYESAQTELKERKHAEEALHRVHAELEIRVTERTSELKSANEFLESMLATALAINSSLDLDEVLDLILKRARTLIPCRALNIMLIEDQNAFIARRIGFEGLERIERNLINQQFPLAWPTFSKMVETGQKVYLPDTMQAEEWQNANSSRWARSFIGIPLRMGQDTLGFLNASHDSPDFFTDSHITILEALANQASTAIHNANLHNDLRTALEKEKAAQTRLIHSERLALAGRLLATVSHELNNPIQAIQNTLYLLKDEMEISEQGREDLSILLAETERMAALIERLRSVYRPIRSDETVPLQFNDLIDDIRVLTAAQFRHKNIHIESSLDPDLPLIRGNPDQLKQVILNLMVNALDATPAGGLISFRSHAIENKIVFSIKDTGPGIAPEVLPQIFDAFVTGKNMGTGLGLTIVHDIIMRHHGQIEAVNPPEGGALFTFRLPIQAQNN